MPNRLWWLMETAARDVTRSLPEWRCLVLAPHPDDEVLACGGTLAETARRGGVVAVAFLTDGRHGLKEPAERAAAIRQEEARRAAECLGVPADHLLFLGFEDGRLSQHIDDAIELLQDTIRDLRVNVILTSYHREFHPDHIAAAKIGRAFRRQVRRVLEYPIWFGPYLWDRLGWRGRAASLFHLADSAGAVKVNIAPVAELKRQAMAAHRSQVLGFAERGAWGERFLDNFFGGYEFFFVRR